MRSAMPCASGWLASSHASTASMVITGSSRASQSSQRSPTFAASRLRRANSTDAAAIWSTTVRNSGSRAAYRNSSRNPSWSWGGGGYQGRDGVVAELVGADGIAPALRPARGCTGPTGGWRRRFCFDAHSSRQRLQAPTKLLFGANDFYIPVAVLEESKPTGPT